MRNLNNDRLVVIDHGSHNVRNYANDYAVVCVNVTWTTTVAITAVEAGYRCFPVDGLVRALSLSNTMEDRHPVLVGDMNGTVPPGFDMLNSPAEVAKTLGSGRPLILYSSVGTSLIREAGLGLAAFLACFRNMTATAATLVGRYRKIALLGDSSGGEFREEDQMCCAWIAGSIADAGFRPATRFTRDIMKRWKSVGSRDLLMNAGLESPRFTHREADLEFILDHQDDLRTAHMIAEGEVIELPAPEVFFKSLPVHRHEKEY